jgi:hypothetical protein
MRGTAEERFWGKVTKTAGCWEWTGTTNTHGYGHHSITGKTIPAHRFAYELLVGPIPTGMIIDHTCHNRACVNPRHLRPVTQKQNAEHRAGPKRNTTSGVLGVSWRKELLKWHARVMHNGKSTSCGYFADLAEAESVVVAKRLELFTHNDADRSA